MKLSFPRYVLDDDEHRGSAEETLSRISVLDRESFFQLREETAGMTRWFAELWQFRELVYFLAWRDVKIRYKQAALGATWAVLQPLLTMAVFTIFFARLVGVPN